MKFNKISNGRYTMRENGIIFDIIKCNKAWLMEYYILHKEYKEHIGRISFNTLKMCKIYANHLCIEFKGVGLC